MYTLCTVQNRELHLQLWVAKNSFSVDGASNSDAGHSAHQDARELRRVNLLHLLVCYE